MSNEVALSSASLMPQTYEGKLQMAGALAKSGLIPQGLNTPEKVFVALQWGHELGLSPMVAVNNVAVINGKPTLSADIMAAVVKRSPEYGGIEWVKNTESEAECIITRILSNGKTESITSRFTMQDAVNAGLANKTVWKQYPRRMLKHRCLSYGLKDMFPDILAGLYTPEEMESVSDESNEEPKERNITPVEEQTTNVQTGKKVIAEEVSDRDKLSDIYKQYYKKMRAEVQDTVSAALNGDDDSQVQDVLKRTIAYLSQKGIQVA